MTDPTSPVQTGGQATAARSMPAPVYLHLSTDFYPWDEVIADLKTRSQAGQSLLFQANSDAACASFVWKAGQLLGGYSGARDLNFAALMRGLPRARVTLVPLDERAAAAMWEHRAAAGQTLRGTGAQVAGQLAGQTGVLSGMGAAPQAMSYWEEGEPRWGHWTPDAPEQDWRFVALRRTPDAAALTEFWRQVLAVTHRRAAVDEVWRQVSLALAPHYPVLDPFVREVTVRTGELQVEPSVRPQELQPALLAAYRAVLARLGLRLSDLPLSTLRQHELWNASGLPALEGEGA
ncbi:hypothetical protein GCM10017783_20160 [Deinococcus piscis]|uniref:ABC transporter substrate-binding protein n=1 Tax=Deinococcus piscis TaxID=394230 RepID=A0ABQ3K7T7_9DEIO|nr:hypothetical protein [Deinococcus piscis]GHG07598.1 hypothetical protein GCM10017783_20160 [Deinococcus piscis]